MPRDHPAISSWLNRWRTEFDFIFYLADETPTEWTKKCVRQADALSCWCGAGASTELNPCEQFAFSVHLALGTPPGDPARGAHRHRVAAPSLGCAKRDIFMHHHVTLQDTADVGRLYRFLSGRAVGFVAGGGGALGSAHLGAYKAFCEAGADFDILGGTSVGAAMTAALACGVDPERVDEGTHKSSSRAAPSGAPRCRATACSITRYSTGPCGPSTATPPSRIYGGRSSRFPPI